VESVQFSLSRIQNLSGTNLCILSLVGLPGSLYKSLPVRSNAPCARAHQSMQAVEFVREAQRELRASRLPVAGLAARGMATVFELNIKLRK